MWKSVQRIISTVLTVCLLITICPARAFASEVEQEVPAPAAESSTPIITLKNYDGSATLTTIETTAGTVFTQAALSAEVDLLDAVRGGYKFVGWSTTVGEVTSSYVPTESFTVNESMTLYAVHRPLVASDVNADIGSDFLTSIETFDTVVGDFGFSADTLASASVRSSDFYSYIDEYVDTTLADETTVALSIAAADSSSPTISAQRFEHAFQDAVWSKNQRADVHFAKEVVYMFTSHYIDVAEPLSGTTINHDQTLYQLYITDLDRRTYETFYQNGSHLDLYESMFSFVSALCDVPGFVENASLALNSRKDKLTRVKGALDAVIDGVGIAEDTLLAEINDAYLDISLMTYVDKADLHTQLDDLVESVYNNLSVDYTDMTISAATSIVTAALLLTGSTLTLSSVFGLVGFYSDFFATLFDRAYYVTMRAYIQTRVGERMMYALGMSDGRN
ncbi:MAG: InlB B-repeat-containing protein [Oscillospiraceae bacterium]|nr:InlB B-repeat-containing protein [Oscillospiraceae bacterium]